MSGKGLGQSVVTNKWLVGILVSLVISMGGYIFNNLDRTRDFDLGRADATERRVNALEIQMAGVQAEIRAQFAEILRRLDRMERRQHRHDREDVQ